MVVLEMHDRAFVVRLEGAARSFQGRTARRAVRQRAEGLFENQVAAFVAATSPIVGNPDTIVGSAPHASTAAVVRELGAV
jgi:hypothetical protein